MRKTDNALAGVYMGIDPNADGEGHGVATITMRDGRPVAIHTDKMTLPALVEMANALHAAGTLLMVFVEAGWLKSGNWHVSPKMKATVAASTGHKVGRNHQAGIDLCECLKYYGIPYRENIPFDKHWGDDGRSKISQKELAKVVARRGLTIKRMSQDERDALLFAWVLSEL